MRDEDDETPEHLEFKSTLKKLKSPRLKDVCKANHLMVAGSKSDLLERIVGCRLHGHSWRRVPSNHGVPPLLFVVHPRVHGCAEGAAA